MGSVDLSMDSDELEDKAVRFLESGRLKDSAQILKQMLAKDRNCLAAHFHLARVYWRMGRYKGALKHASRTLALHPNEPNANLNLGVIYEAVGRYKEAIAQYKKELALNPNSLEALWNLGRLYYDKHRWLSASKCLQRCFDLGYMIEIDDTVDKLGMCYRNMKDARSYIKLFERYVQMFPNAAWAYANLGRALLYVKKYKKAALRLSRANQLGCNVSNDLKVAKSNLARGGL